MTDTPADHVRLVAQAILTSLGHQAPPWQVLHVGPTAQPATSGGSADAPDLALHSWHTGTPPPTTDLHEHKQLSVVLGPAGHGPQDAYAVTAYYPLYLPAGEATAVLASQIQDHATEAAASRGLPLPPCPDHSHPLSARVADGIAEWQCPTSPQHYRAPIVDGTRPATA